MATQPPKNDFPEVVDAPKELNLPQMTDQQLLKMVVESQREQAKAYDKLAEALVESRKPYIDPAVLQAKKDALEERKRQIVIELLRRRETKRQCHHHRVDDQDNIQPKMNIHWMRHADGSIRGVCGRCNSQFDATHNAEDAKLLRQSPTVMNTMGRARS